jgi:peptide/nickel transport system permease protein
VPRLLLRRLAISVPLLVVVCSTTFFLAALIPGDLARTIAGPNASQAQYLTLRHELGLNKPITERYWAWLTAAVHGNLGRSLFSQEPVTSLLDTRLPATLSLVVGSTLLAAILGVGLGIASARSSGLLGRAVDALALIGLAMPSFFVGLLLVSWFAVSLQLLPATGYVPFTQSPAQWAKSLILPVITLALPGVAVVAKQTRDSVKEVSVQPFVRTLRASGISRHSIMFKHVLRSASIPVATVIGLVFVGALSGTVLVESVFAMPGLGGLAVQATANHDLPLIQGVVVYFTLIVVAVNLVVDLTYGALDPRVRVS